MKGYLFVVQRLALDRYGSPCTDGQSGADNGSRVPLRAFSNRTMAESYRSKLEQWARVSLNPFVLFDYPSVEDPNAFRSRLEELGLESPATDKLSFWGVDWFTWWDHLQNDLTEQQRMDLWTFLVERPLYEVVEIELED